MYVLMHKKTRPTGRKVAMALGLKARYKTPLRGDTVAIRWGTAEHPAIASSIQSAEAIARAGNKLVSFQCFARDGVPHPEVKTHLDTADGVWFGRSTHGMCGLDIEVIQPNTRDFGRHDFYTRFIPNRREYRIHVFKDTILAIMGKYLDFPTEVGDSYIKNHLHGYRFRTPDKQLNKDRTDAAIAAVKALGLDFGAVDLIIGDDGKAYVLEVNTAPALFPLTFAKYIEAFKRELGL